MSNLPILFGLVLLLIAHPAWDATYLSMTPSLSTTSYLPSAPSFYASITYLSCDIRSSTWVNADNVILSSQLALLWLWFLHAIFPNQAPCLAMSSLSNSGNRLLQVYLPLCSSHLSLYHSFFNAVFSHEVSKKLHPHLRHTFRVHRVCQDKIQGHSSTFQGPNFIIQGHYEWGQMNLLTCKIRRASVVDKCTDYCFCGVPHVCVWTSSFLQRTWLNIIRSTRQSEIQRHITLCTSLRTGRHAL